MHFPTISTQDYNDAMFEPDDLRIFSVQIDSFFDFGRAMSDDITD